MKKISIFALLSIVVFPAFATDAVMTEVSKSDTMVERKLSEEERLRLKNEFKEEIKSELKQEYTEKKHSEKIAFPNGVQIGVGASLTGGLNGFVGYMNKDFDSFWAKRFGIRFDFATTRPIKSLVKDAVDAVIDNGLDVGDGLTIGGATVDAKHFAAMLDFYPFGDAWLLGPWRISAGYYIGNMNASADIAATVDELTPGYHNFKLMNTEFRYLGNSVNGTAEFDWDYRGPYLGTGFDFGLFGGFKIYLDAGVVFTNRAIQLNLNVPFDNLEMYQDGAWKDVESGHLESVVDSVVAETLSDAQSELDDLKFYPIVKLGFMYRF
jgi:hypothetical protein